MLKFRIRTVFAAAMAAAVLMSLPSIANAQLPQASVEQLVPKYRAQGPCRDPWVTIAIIDAFASTRAINGVGDFGDCDKSRYNGGSWSNYAELYRAVKTAFDNAMSVNLAISKQALANGSWKITTTLPTNQGTFINNQIISHDGGTLITSDGASLSVGSTVVSQGGGNILTNNGGTLVGSGGSSVVSQGGGNFRVLSVSGDEASVNLGRSILLLRKGGSTPPTTSAGGSSNTSGAGSSTPPGRGLTGSDDQILICINNRGAVQAIKRAGGLSFTVSAGTVYYSGSVANQFSKDQLVDTAKSCSARAVNTDKLRIGR
jgi:hypothetical protein